MNPPPKTEHTPSHVRQVAATGGASAMPAALAGLALLPCFWLTQAVAGFRPVEPALGAPDEEFLAFYVANVSRVPVSALLFTAQWLILLVFLVSMVRVAAGTWEGLAPVLAVTIAGAATALYVGAEGVRLWPVTAAGMSADTLRAEVAPALVRAALLSRDGLHAPAGVLVGVCVLITAWLLARSRLWGRWPMSGLALVAGLFALSSILVGPDGFGPGLVFVLWAPVTAAILLVGRRRAGRGSVGPPVETAAPK